MTKFTYCHRIIMHTNTCNTYASQELSNSILSSQCITSRQSYGVKCIMRERVLTCATLAFFFVWVFSSNIVVYIHIHICIVYACIMFKRTHYSCVSHTLLLSFEESESYFYGLVFVHILQTDFTPGLHL